MAEEKKEKKDNSNEEEEHECEECPPKEVLSTWILHFADMATLLMAFLFL